MLLWIPMLLVGLALVFGAPVVAVRASAELTRGLSRVVRYGVAVLAVTVSLWWLVIPSPRWAFFWAVMSWLAVAMMAVEANYRRRARLTAADGPDARRGVLVPR